MIKNRKHNNSFNIPVNFFSIKFKDIRLKIETNLEKDNTKNFKENKNIKVKNNKNTNIINFTCFFLIYNI